MIESTNRFLNSWDQTNPLWYGGSRASLPYFNQRITASIVIFVVDSIFA